MSRSSTRDKAPTGRMHVVLVVHGGTQEFEQVMDGLVERNARGIREGVIPLPKHARITHREEPVWRDGLLATADHVASAGTLTAWHAGAERARGLRTAGVAMVGGVPVVVDRHASGAMHIVGNPVAAAGWTSSCVRGLVGATAKRDQGRITEYIVLGIDDRKGLPVREFGDAIARHNARRIRIMGYPGIYESGVYYQTEGSPELWWDVDEILAQGHDDCEGLAAYRAGELLLRGHKARVWTRNVPSADVLMGGRGDSRSRLFHAVTRVELPGGKVAWDDPSMRLGMPVPPAYAKYLGAHRMED